MSVNNEPPVPKMQKEEGICLPFLCIFMYGIDGHNSFAAAKLNHVTGARQQAQFVPRSGASREFLIGSSKS